MAARSSVSSSNPSNLCFSCFFLKYRKSQLHPDTPTSSVPSSTIHLPLPLPFPVLTSEEALWQGSSALARFWEVFLPLCSCQKGTWTGWTGWDGAGAMLGWRDEAGEGAH